LTRFKTAFFSARGLLNSANISAPSLSTLKWKFFLHILDNLSFLNWGWGKEFKSDDEIRESEISRH
jgi:hypothetical protein